MRPETHVKPKAKKRPGKRAGGRVGGESTTESRVDNMNVVGQGMCIDGGRTYQRIDY